MDLFLLSNDGVRVAFDGCETSSGTVGLSGISDRLAVVLEEDLD